jgi:hypothetical protein
VYLHESFKQFSWQKTVQLSAISECTFLIIEIPASYIVLSIIDGKIKILKNKLWIVGVFGVYLSLFILVGFLNQLTFILGLTEITELLIQATIVLGWGFIPFVLFWIGYIIIFIYKATEETLKYQFGGFLRDK